MRGHRAIEQLSLFTGTGAPAFDGSFAALTRTELSDGAWYEYAPGWLSGDEALFALLRETVHFRSEKRAMYERIVEVPRLVASLPDDGPIPGVLDAARAVLGQRYGEAFARVSLGYYRNGEESVAWHGDYVAPSCRPRSSRRFRSGLRGAFSSDRRAEVRPARSRSVRVICSSWAAAASAPSSTRSRRFAAPGRAWR